MADQVRLCACPALSQLTRGNCRRRCAWDPLLHARAGSRPCRANLHAHGHVWCARACVVCACARVRARCCCGVGPPRPGAPQAKAEPSTAAKAPPVSESAAGKAAEPAADAKPAAAGKAPAAKAAAAAADDDDDDSEDEEEEEDDGGGLASLFGNLVRTARARALAT